MIIGGIEFDAKLEKKFGPHGILELKKFVEKQDERGIPDAWDGVSFEAGWSAALKLVRDLTQKGRLDGR